MALRSSRTCWKQQSLKRNQHRNRARQSNPFLPNQRQRRRRLFLRHRGRPHLAQERKKNTEPNSSCVTPALPPNESSATCSTSRSVKTRRHSCLRRHRIRKKQTASTLWLLTVMVHRSRCSAAKESTRNSPGTKTTLNSHSPATKKMRAQSSRSFVFTTGTAKIRKLPRSFQSP